MVEIRESQQIHSSPHIYDSLTRRQLKDTYYTIKESFEIHDGLQEHRTNLTEEETQILLLYRGQLEELTVNLHHIPVEWQTLNIKDTFDTNEW